MWIRSESSLPIYKTPPNAVKTSLSWVIHTPESWINPIRMDFMVDVVDVCHDCLPFPKQLIQYLPVFGRLFNRSRLNSCFCLRVISLTCILRLQWGSTVAAKQAHVRGIQGKTSSEIIRSLCVLLPPTGTRIHFWSPRSIYGRQDNNILTLTFANLFVLIYKCVLNTRS